MNVRTGEKKNSLVLMLKHCGSYINMWQHILRSAGITTSTTLLFLVLGRVVVLILYRVISKVALSRVLEFPRAGLKTSREHLSTSPAMWGGSLAKQQSDKKAFVLWDLAVVRYIYMPNSE